MAARRFDCEDPPEDFDGDGDAPLRVEPDGQVSFLPAPPRESRKVGPPPPLVLEAIQRLRDEFARSAERRRRDAPGIWI